MLYALWSTGKLIRYIGNSVVRERIEVSLNSGSTSGTCSRSAALYSPQSGRINGAHSTLN